MPVNLGGNEINSVGVRLLNDTSLYKTNLVWLWDAGLISSYPGSGGTWTEWVSGTNNGTLTNGPTYSNVGGGSILFDGSNDYISFNTFTLGGPPWSVSFWFKTSSTDGGLFSHYSGGPVGNAFETQSGKLTYRYYNNLGWNQSPASTTSVNTNTWVYATFSTGASATSTFTYYYNGIADGTFTPAGTGVGGGNMGSIGMLWGFSNFNGYIAQVSVHTTQLSAAQILQNYNSQRQRFGV
jgi:hypothetical protein